MRLGHLWTLGILALAAAATVVPLSPIAVERGYSTAIYPSIQRVLTPFSNLVPFALLDVMLLVLPLAWLALAARDVRRSARPGRAVVGWTVRTATAAAVLYLLFLAFWGLNYRRLPLEKKLPYDAKAVTVDAARETLRLTIMQLNALYAHAHAAGSEAGDDPLLANGFARATRELGADGATVPGRPKRTILDLYFRPAAVAGMTDPFFLETLVESDLLPVERPFVVAHEWTHLAGFADEGEANFGGWLTCARSGALAQYSGWLFLFGELANSLPPGERPALIAPLAEGPQADLRAIAARLARDVTPRVSAAGWRVYDRYLKANRVAAGAASYGQVVRLVLGTRLGLNAAESASPAR